MLGQIRVSRMIGTIEGAVENAVEIYQGEAVDLPFTVVNAVGAPVDITSLVVHWRVKRTVSDAAVLVEKVSTDPAEVSKDNPTKGIGTVYVLSADFAELEPGVYEHELWLVDGGETRIAIVPTPLQLSEAGAPTVV